MKSNDNFAIRKYETRDRDDVNACIRQLQEHEREMERRMKPFSAISGTYLEALLSSCTARQGRIFVAESDAGVVGYVCVTAREENTDEDEIAYDFALVRDLVVKDEHRGRGIGRALLAEAEHYALECGARWVRISVLAKNVGAASLYERAGFAPRVIEMEKPLVR